MPASQSERTLAQFTQEFEDELSRVSAEQKAKWDASPAGKRAAARQAEWDAKTPEEQEAYFDALSQDRVGEPRPIDEFTGMDDDEANFLRDWLSD